MEYIYLLIQICNLNKLNLKLFLNMSDKGSVHSGDEEEAVIELPKV